MKSTDEEMGRLAKALLEDLGARETYEGRLLTVVRTLRHLEAGRERSGPDRIGDLPSYGEFESLLRDKTTSPMPRPPPESRKRSKRSGGRSVVDNGYHSALAALARRDTGHLLDTSPGPLTRASRNLATLAASAHLACQWGEFQRAVPMLWSVTLIIGELMHRAQSLGHGEGLCRVYILSGTGAFAAARPVPVTATCLARRTAADLGAIARAAARVEGRAELDSDFEDIGSDSVSGFHREAATGAVEQIRRALATPLRPELNAPDGT